MTAHIDNEQEFERCECDPHDTHKLQKALNKCHYSKRGWIAMFFISVFFNVLFIARVEMDKKDEDLLKACQEQIDYFGALDSTNSAKILDRFKQMTQEQDRFFVVNKDGE